MKIHDTIRMCIHHTQLAALVLLVLVLPAACNSQEFVEETNQFINPMPSIPASNVTQQNQGAERRPFPTPFPTIELPPTPTPTIEPGEGLQEELELGIEELENAFSATLFADALRASITNENLTNGEQESFLFEFVRPDNFHLLTADSEVILTDGITYRRQLGTNWLISPVQTMEEFDGIFDPYLKEEVAKAEIEDLLSTTTDIQVGGQIFVGGTEYYVVTFTRIQPADLLPKLTTVWLGVEDRLLYRQITDFVEDDQNFRMIIAYAYGEDVEITRPYP